MQDPSGAAVYHLKGFLTWLNDGDFSPQSRGLGIRVLQVVREITDADRFKAYTEELAKGKAQTQAVPADPNSGASRRKTLAIGRSDSSGGTRTLASASARAPAASEQAPGDAAASTPAASAPFAAAAPKPAAAPAAAPAAKKAAAKGQPAAPEPAPVSGMRPLLLAPKGSEIEELLSGLTGQDIAANSAAQLKPGPNQAIATYITTEEKKVAALAIYDFELAIYCGAALSMIPPDRAKELVQEKNLSEEPLSNFKEVVNVQAGSFNKPNMPHVKLDQVLTSYDELPEEAKKILELPAARVDFEVEVATYGKGRAALLIGGSEGGS
jgi:hypothetical protein